MKRSKKRRGPSRKHRAKKAERWRLQFRSVEFVLFVKSLKCVRCGKHAITMHVHHDPTRGNGGTWKDTSPLCLHCHARRHSKGVETFWSEVGRTYTRSNAETQKAWLGDTCAP